MLLRRTVAAAGELAVAGDAFGDVDVLASSAAAMSTMCASSGPAPMKPAPPAPAAPVRGGRLAARYSTISPSSSGEALAPRETMPLTTAAQLSRV
ncbi:MAG: hypothetical protein R2724_06130 [Bryobacterales bacterium]